MMSQVLGATLCLMTGRVNEQDVTAGSRPAATGAPVTVRDRLLNTAVAQIERQGMSVSLEHISLERVIAESGVSRASAYRHFANKAQFLTEVLTTVVRSTRLEGETPAQVEELLGLLTQHPDWLATEQGRRDLAVEGLRLTARADFERIASSPQWRTYIALHATCRGLPEGELRTHVLGALLETETDFTAHRAGVYARLASLLGYRLVEPLSAPEGFLVMADAAGALLTGLVVRAPSPQGHDPATVNLAAHGSTETGEWTWPAYHLAGLVLAHLEPDPGIIWDEAQRARAVTLLDEMLEAVNQMRPSQPVAGERRREQS
jgi:AcrR family transcriptional regulator